MPSRTAAKLPDSPLDNVGYFALHLNIVPKTYNGTILDNLTFVGETPKEGAARSSGTTTPGAPGTFFIWFITTYSPI